MFLLGTVAWQASSQTALLSKLKRFVTSVIGVLGGGARTVEDLGIQPERRLERCK